jgi:hypothetical protein
LKELWACRELFISVHFEGEVRTESSKNDPVPEKDFTLRKDSEGLG